MFFEEHQFPFWQEELRKFQRLAKRCPHLIHTKPRLLWNNKWKLRFNYRYFVVKVPPCLNFQPLPAKTLKLRLYLIKFAISKTWEHFQGLTCHADQLSFLHEHLKPNSFGVMENCEWAWVMWAITTKSNITYEIYWLIGWDKMRICQKVTLDET